MSEYRASTSLQAPQAAVARSVTFATSSDSGSSNPNEQRWWCTKFGLGPAKLVPSLGSTKTGPTRVAFETTSRAAVAAITFSPRGTTSHQLAVVAGPRVSLYGPGGGGALSRALSRGGKSEGEPNLFGKNANEGVRPDRTIGTGGSPARSAAYRRDGRLLAVGTDNGDVRVCDATSRVTLRTFRAGNGKGGHPVRAVKWLNDGKRIVSGGDDAVVRLWDLSGNGGGIGGGGDSAAPILSMVGHGDSVRSVVVLRVKDGSGDKSKSTSGSDTRHLAVSGSYDHTVRVWNIEKGTDEEEDGSLDNRCMSVMDHGAPVEDLLVFPVTATQITPLVASAGGTFIKVWNPLTGQCVLTVQTKHSKTITSICLIDIVRNDHSGKERISNKRLVTAGLDGLIRIHAADDLSEKLPYLHGVKTPHPITSIASSPDCARLIVGTSNGLVTVRQRGRIVPQGVSLKRKARLQAGTYSYFMRGADVSADADDHVILMARKKKLKSYDVLLKKFRYGDALDEALVSRQPDAIMAVLEELGKRRGLSQALSNRDEETLEPILSFTARYIAKPRYTPVLIGVADRLCEIYGGVVGQSEIIDEHFDKLRRHIKDECRVQKCLLRLLGQIDSTVCAAELQSEDSD